MNEPLISVIVPIYNVETYLRRCLDSLRSQTWQNLQIVLVDDGSPDDCGSICDEYAAADPRFEVIHQTNGGVARARNTGLDAVRGEWIAFVDPDDWVDGDYIDFLYRLAVEHHADVACCGAENICPSQKHIRPPDEGAFYQMDARTALECMCYNDKVYVTLWDKLYRSELFRGVRFEPGKKFEDTGGTYRVIQKAQNIVVRMDVKYHYVTVRNSITTSRFDPSKLDYVEMADRMADDVTAAYPDLRPAADRKRVHAYFSTLCQLVNSRVREPEIEKDLILRIRRYRKEILSDPRAPRRDKAAILSLLPGRRVFSLAWRVYLHVAK